MRMRKKKNCAQRMEKCSDIWIRDPENYKGKWSELFGNNNPIHIITHKKRPFKRSFFPKALRRLPLSDTQESAIYLRPSENLL